MDENAIKRIVQDTVKQEMKFTSRKLTDTPVDRLQVVNRNYSNLNGVVADRPNSSVATVGQKYFATDTKNLMIWDGTNWYNGTASIVAS